MVNGAYKVDLLKTESRLNEVLRKRLDFLHYRSAYEDFAEIDTTQCYSGKTDPAEKLRQFFSENSRPNIMIVPGGYLALRQWVPSKQTGLFSRPPCFEEIDVDTDVTWESGYDTGLRVPHMKDYFNDAYSEKRKERRKVAAMVEHHVSNYFRDRYPQFWIAPTNYQKEDRPARDDFGLEIPATASQKLRILLDVKSLTHADSDDDVDDRERTGVVRKIHNEIVYLFADWDRKDKKIRMYGLDTGLYLKEAGICQSDLSLIRSKCLLPIDVLLVMLNIAKREPFGAKFRAMQAAAADSRPLGIKPITAMRLVRREAA